MHTRFFVHAYRACAIERLLHKRHLFCRSFATTTINDPNIMARITRASATKGNEAQVDVKEAPQQLSSPPATPAPAKKRSTRVKAEPPATPADTGRKRGRTAVKEDGDVNGLPHNMGTAMPSPAGDDTTDAEPPKKRTRSTKKEVASPQAVKAKDDEAAINDSTPKKNPNKTPKKSKGYGLTPGVTPFPEYGRPTPAECKEVVRLLEKVHGKVTVPKAIPPPSLDVAGCGEVPSVLDALIRTRLSANTTNKNSSTAFQGLVKTFGVIDEGIGKGSVDWDKVRRAPFKEVFHAIERGGLANVKAKDIQAILQIAYEQNQERKQALQNTDNKPAGAEKEPEPEKEAEIHKASANIISLDHLHLLKTPEAIAEMLKLPGIGPKTASCVALFCMQRPSFAVDTHVFRLCQYLGWVPKSTKKGQPKVDRNTTYSHCDVRIPDEYKYPLHHLLIKHGKMCPRCRAATGQTSANWDEGCPIEHLVKRHGSKKGGMSQADRKKAQDAAALGEDGDLLMEAEAPTAGVEDESELSELVSDGDDHKQ